MVVMFSDLCSKEISILTEKTRFLVISDSYYFHSEVNRMRLVI